MTRDLTVNKYVDADFFLENVHREGHELYYNATENKQLKGRTVYFSGGEQARPAEEGYGPRYIVITGSCLERFR